LIKKVKKIEINLNYKLGEMAGKKKGGKTTNETPKQGGNQ